jgi:hypothetical protein
VRGARAVSRSVLSDFPKAKVRVAFVWIDMVAGDSRATADSLAASIRDPRAEHMHDVNKAAGTVIAESLGASGQVAWDIYLLYPPASRWLDRMPQPLDWAHQLGETELADASRYRSGAALDAKLHEWMEKLVV